MSLSQRCVDFHCLSLGYENPYQPDTRFEVFTKFPIYLAFGVSFAQYFNRQIGYQARNCLFRELAARQTLPRNERNIRCTNKADHQPQEPCFSEDNAQVVLAQVKFDCEN